MSGDPDYGLFDSSDATQTIAETCDSCGEYVPIGGWPFCASPHNPAGHAKGAAYGFKMAFGMATNGWTRRER